MKTFLDGVANGGYVLPEDFADQLLKLNDSVMSQAHRVRLPMPQEWQGVEIHVGSADPENWWHNLKPYSMKMEVVYDEGFQELSDEQVRQIAAAFMLPKVPRPPRNEGSQNDPMP